MATASYDPHLGAGPSEDSEILLDDSDSGSVLSEDSVLPDYEIDDDNADPAKTLYEACSRNDCKALCRILERGITKEEAMELDINSRVRGMELFTSTDFSSETTLNQSSVLFLRQNGLMVAISKGFIDIVQTLNVCPLIEINHQDNDGNTALMIAAQAGACARTRRRRSHPKTRFHDLLFSMQASSTFSTTSSTSTPAWTPRSGTPAASPHSSRRDCRAGKSAWPRC